MTGVLRTIVRWAPTTAFAAVIFRMSSLPGGSVPSRFSELAHFVEYALFAAIIFVAISKKKANWSDAVLLAAMAASAYGITDELHQAFVPGRMPDVFDWLLDTAGALTGATIAVLVYRRMLVDLRVRESQ